jgi:hypothetical protein
MLSVFIVRPFGIKSGIDFERVETELIRPAMEQAGLSGGTTGELIQQGDIRADLFEQLLIADLVIADISIHNANVFYELGIRHALRDKRTFLIKSRESDAKDEVPFDLRTDRYLPYDARNPRAATDILAAALKATLDSQKPDSPVYQLLPALEPADPDKVLAVPLDFREEAARAEAAKSCGDLQMLAAETDGFAWRVAGLRLIGKAQFRLQDWPGAKATWLAVREYDDMDREANLLLATIFQRLDDLVRSDQAVERALQSEDLSAADRAESRALMGRNAKARWKAAWEQAGDLRAAQKAALSTPFLERGFELYRQGFVEDRNHIYSGLNALAMATMWIELAQAQPSTWEEGFDNAADAEQKMAKLKELRSDLAAGVRLAIESRQAALQRMNQTDSWLDLSAADLICLTSNRPGRVGQAYKKALAGASDQGRDAVRRQLGLYRSLGILPANIRAALDSIPPAGAEARSQETPPQVILFTGHRIDPPSRATPRFPASREKQARAMIFEAVSKEMEKAQRPVVGVSGGACGGDILFQEICAELNIPRQMYLVLPKNDYLKASVADGGPEWVERFNRLCNQVKAKIFSDSERLPRWLRAKKDYSIWQRSNLWMLHNALYLSQDHLTLIALWNGASGDGPGGTEDMVARARDRGATFVLLDARKLLE